MIGLSIGAALSKGLILMIHARQVSFFEYSQLILVHSSSFRELAGMLIRLGGDPAAVSGGYFIQDMQIIVTM